MPSPVKIELREESYDPRSNFTTYYVSVINQSEEACHLQYVKPILANNVAVVERKDAYFNLLRRQDKLRKRLTALLIKLLENTPNKDNETRDELIRAYRSAAADCLKHIKSRPARAYLSLVTLPVKQKYLSTIIEALSQNPLEIESADQARKLLLTDEDTADHVAHIIQSFEHYANRLSEVERQIATYESREFFTLNGQGIYSAIFGLNFHRGKLAARQYGVTFEVRYKTEENGPVLSETVSQTKVVSPSNLWASLVAIAGAFIGFILKVAESKPAREEFIAYTNSVSLGWGWSWIESPLLQPLLLAFAFFTLYEYTDIGKKLKLQASWRTALLIGLICGLLSERIVKSFQQLI